MAGPVPPLDKFTAMTDFLRARHVVLPEGVRDDAALVVRDGRIVEVVDGASSGADLLDGWLVPGFVDTHCHGGAGADFTDPDPQAVARAIELHRQHGTTTLFASTVTNTAELVAEQVARLADLVDAGELAGIHLEGPCLAVARRGAHAADLLRDPSPELLTTLYAAGRGAVRMITLAPERVGGLAAIRLTAERGIVAAFGHSDADAAGAQAAVDAGASVATHLFNAMRPIHHREPGPVPELLTDQRVLCELICDGIHLDPDVVRLAVRAAGPGRIALVTDAMSATGCADGDYTLGALRARVAGGVAQIVDPDGSLGAIAGSTLTMDRAFAFAVQQVGCSIPAAAAMASTNAARHHGLSEVGELAPGRFADACLVSPAGDLRAVWRRGETVA